LRILILYANPSPTSFGAALHQQVASTLRKNAHSVDDCDLYAAGFDPVLSEDERRVYRDATENRAHVADYVSRLLAAEGLVLIYPVWNEGFPAILKGFLDRVFLPGVSFKIGKDGSAAPNLERLRKLAAVCTYGASWPISLTMGDPPKKIVKRLVRSMPVHRVRCDYLAQYGVDASSAEQRQAFLRKVDRVLATW
jgi:NAD(P)H dehydrogenase (quinone)